MNVRPLHDRLIVQRLAEREQHVGGILIPDTAQEKPQQGMVIAAGIGKVNDDGRRVAPGVHAGDLVLFGKYAGQEIKLDGEDYLIMKEEDVLAAIERRTNSASVGVRGKSKPKSKSKAKAKPKSKSKSTSQAKSKPVVRGGRAKKKR